MHYHLEIIMPKRDDVEAAVTEILLPFNENDEDRQHAFWDGWQIGGRYSGSKLEASVGQDKMDAFFAEIKSRGVTVSGLTLGKQELSPASQIDMVDALWREMCPGGGDVCPIFKHSGDNMNGDICEYKDMPQSLMTYAMIIAAPDYENKKFEAEMLLFQSVWNGVTHQDTTFDGSVAAGIRMHIDKIKNYANADYVKKITPQPDWLVVTVDYHS